MSETSLLGVASFGPAESPVKGSSTLESARFNTDAVASKASPSSDLVLLYYKLKVLLYVLPFIKSFLPSPIVFSMSCRFSTLPPIVASSTKFP